MKKYFLLYLGSLLLVSLPSWSVDYDQDEDEYEQSDDEGTPIQNSMMLQQQPNMMYQNNMMMNQGMFPNDAMMQQPGMILPDGTMNNQVYQNGDEYAHMDNDEYVQSLVNNILQMENEQQNQALNKTKNGEIVVSKNLKNKILKWQKELDEISLGLKGSSTSDESTKKKSKGSSEKDKLSDKSTSKGKKSSKKSEIAKSKSRNKKRNSNGIYKIKTLSTSRKARRFAKKISKFNRSESLHTVKQVTLENAKRFVPEHRFSNSYSLGQSKVKNYKSSVPAKHKVKILGTGEVIPAEVYYQKNNSHFSDKSNSQKGLSDSLNKPNFQKNSTYFSDKSKCDNGCGAQ